MMTLGEKFETSNPPILLKNEEGLFLVWGPGGQVEHYSVHPGASVESITFVEQREPRANYLVEKIGNKSSSAESFRGRAATA